MHNRWRRVSPLQILGALLLLALLYLLFLRPDPKVGPDVPPYDPRLAHLGHAPHWPDLARYDGVLTREEFEAALREVYVLGDRWHCTVTDESVTIHSELQPAGQVIQFASEASRRPPPRYWRPASELPPARAGLPLDGLRIAIDPGHLGGRWARMEERWYQLAGSRAVTEGDMTLLTAKLLAPRLEELGATVSLVRASNEPVTRNRPKDFAAYAARLMPGAPAEEIRKRAESLFYRTAEIRARADLVNLVLQPDLLLCLHFNAENWEDPAAPTFTPRNHFHMILHGAYMDGEITHEDERFEMLHKVFQSTHPEELALSSEMVSAFLEESGLSAYTYPRRDPPTNIQLGPAMWARNLLANRLYQCPVLFFEPYVMNNREVHARVQAGDYAGEREVAGRFRKSIYREYADAVVNGLRNYYTARRKTASTPPQSPETTP